jgi:hypothetical protein
MLQTVDFCGLEVTRLILGANPFGGFSHQNRERDREMVAYHTVDRIIETWGRAEAAGINTMITNNESPHVVQAVREYLEGGGKLQWIAQVNCRLQPDMEKALDEVVAIGARALYIHGGQVDNLFLRGEGETLRRWCRHARSLGVPVGCAGHTPEAHHWVDSLDVTDFHAVPFFTCGSVHNGEGEKFSLSDMLRAVACIQAMRQPCIGYKIMGAGRIDPRMAFEYAFESIKPGDVVNVGMHRGDKDDMVEENVALAREFMGRAAVRKQLLAEAVV